MIKNVATLTKASGEHSASFRQSSELLEAIDGKLGEVTMDLRNISGRSSCQKEFSSDQAVLKFQPSNSNGTLLSGSPTIKDVSTSPAIQQPVEVKFRGLSQQAQDLAALQGSILQRIKEQAKELEQRAFVEQDNILLAKVEELIRLRETTRQDLALLTKELEWKLEVSRTSELHPTVPCVKRSVSVTEDSRECHVSAWSAPRDVALCACTSVHKMPRARPTNRTGVHAPV
jgi:hypothetical protein